MRRLISGWVIALAALWLPAGAGAQSLDPYDGRNPFKCKPQRVGTGTDFPRPDADPFCVVFDKTNQDVSALGVADFLSQEPDRIGAAFGKCFYHQRDEWRGSVIAGGEGELYHWNGSYFFDLARGAGAAYFANARVLGSGGDPGYVDFVPAPLAPYVHPTGGGGFVNFAYPADPACAERVDTRAERRKVYRRWYLRVG